MPHVTELLVQLLIHRNVLVHCCYLEDVEGFELDVGALVPQQVHHQLEVLGLADVARHHREVVPVQQQLAKKLHRHTEKHSRFRVQRVKYGLIYAFYIGKRLTCCPLIHS